MALSLDDLKNKRPPRANLPKKSDAAGAVVPSKAPQRKKLMPWDPIPIDEPVQQSDVQSRALVEHESIDKNLDEPGAGSSKINDSTSGNPRVGLNGEQATTLSENGRSALNESGLPVLNDVETLMPSTLFSNQGQSNEYRHSTDTVPTQISVDHSLINIADEGVNQPEYRHNTDTVPTHLGIDYSHKDLVDEGVDQPEYRHNTDTVPTQLGVVGVSINKAFSKSTDTVPTQFIRIEECIEEIPVSTIQSSQIKSTDTIPTHILNESPRHWDLNENNPKYKGTDTVPTQIFKTSSDSQKVPTQIKRKPTQYRHYPDTETTQVPTQKKADPPKSTDTNINHLSPVSERYFHLRGLQKTVMYHISRYCIVNKTNIFRCTYNQLANQTSIAAGSVRTTTKRLRNEGFLIIHAPVKGPDSFIDLSLPDEVLRVVAKQAIENLDTSKKVPTQNQRPKLNSTDTSTDTNPSSMYVGINNNTIHTEPTPPIEQQPDFWAELKDVDYSALAPWNIRANIIETFRKNKWEVSRVDLEETMERFVRFFTEPEFLERSSKIKSPYSFFLACVRSVAQNEPSPIQDIKTQVELAQAEAAKNRLVEMERRRREHEEMLKKLDLYRDSEFEIWIKTLSPQDQIRLVEPTALAKVGSVSYRQLLKSHYTEYVWPEIKQSFLG